MKRHFWRNAARGAWLGAPKIPQGITLAALAPYEMMVALEQMYQEESARNHNIDGQRVAPLALKKYTRKES